MKGVTQLKQLTHWHAQSIFGEEPNPDTSDNVPKMVMASQHIMVMFVINNMSHDG